MLNMLTKTSKQYKRNTPYYLYKNKTESKGG